MDLLFHKQSSFQASQAPTGSFDNQATKGDGLMHSEIEIEQSMQRLREIEKEGGIERGRERPQMTSTFIFGSLRYPMCTISSNLPLPALYNCVDVICGLGNGRWLTRRVVLRVGAAATTILFTVSSRCSRARLGNSGLLFLHVLYELNNWTQRI